jgi:hypothetical protein
LKAFAPTVTYSTGSIAADLSTILDIASYIFSMVALVRLHRYVQARNFQIYQCKGPPKIKILTFFSDSMPKLSIRFRLVLFLLTHQPPAPCHNAILRQGLSPHSLHIHAFTSTFTSPFTYHLQSFRRLMATYCFLVTKIGFALFPHLIGAKQGKSAVCC